MIPKKFESCVGQHAYKRQSDKSKEHFEHGPYCGFIKNISTCAFIDEI